MLDKIKDSIQDSIAVKQKLFLNEQLLSSIAMTAQATIAMYQNGGTFYAAGNGGSATDSQHIVAELVGRFMYDRAPLKAFSLAANMSNITCIGNDYGYDEIFARQIWASGKKGDIFLAISTSGNSPNILKAVVKAQAAEMKVIALTGGDGGQLARHADILINVPSKNTARIQESHILIGHILCEIVESQLFPITGSTT